MATPQAEQEASRRRSWENLEPKQQQGGEGGGAVAAAADCCGGAGN